ncbi:MAG: hypothetical protein ABIG61_00350 [Planctomycetota bacterium]
MPLVTKKVLVTVKAPPHPSKKYQEINCCAGIDIDTGRWIRLYPIPFRLLDDDKKFPKYSIITVKCEKPKRDRRVESYRVNEESISIEKWLDTNDNWAARNKIVLPTVSPSFCSILKKYNEKSLGCIKPAHVEFHVEKVSKKPSKKHENVYSQLRLFDKSLIPLEHIPYAFYYTFKCVDTPSCQGHKLMIEDWEIVQSYRRWKARYPEKELLSNIRKKWFSELCSPKRDTYFFVGNMHRFPKQFLILGVFYPPRSQPSLFTH